MCCIYVSPVKNKKLSVPIADGDTHVFSPHTFFLIITVDFYRANEWMDKKMFGLVVF